MWWKMWSNQIILVGHPDLRWHLPLANVFPFKRRFLSVSLLTMTSPDWLKISCSHWFSLQLFWLHTRVLVSLWLLLLSSVCVQTFAQVIWTHPTSFRCHGLPKIVHLTNADFGHFIIWKVKSLMLAWTAVTFRVFMAEAVLEVDQTSSFKELI